MRRPLSIAEILRWADAHREATGRWPSADSGGVAQARFETWAGVNSALGKGCRGLPGGSSLAQLLARERGAPNHCRQPPLTEAQVLQWADSHHARTGAWPSKDSGPIPDVPHESWLAVEGALRRGRRGFPGGSSLARFLAQHRGVRNRKGLPPLTEAQILDWADTYRVRHGRWPTHQSGQVEGAPGETWRAANDALYKGRRGLPGGSSLALLLAEHRGARNWYTRPPLTVEQILSWADQHHVRTGTWPTQRSGPVADAPGETWVGVHEALLVGVRGFPGGSSLAQLLAEQRGVRNQARLPRLTRRLILTWADGYRARTGRWPNCRSGAIPEAPGETWSKVENALRVGLRGLRGGSSVVRLLARHRGVRNPQGLARLSLKRVVRWADAYRAPRSMSVE